MPRGKFLGLVDLVQPLVMYYFVLAIFLLAFLFIYRVIHCRSARYKGDQENEPRAVSLGYDADRQVHRVPAVGDVWGPPRVEGDRVQLAALTDVYWERRARSC